MRVNKFNWFFIRPEAEKIFWFSVLKNSCGVLEKACGVLEKACGVEFLKHGVAVNFSRVVGVDPGPSSARTPMVN